MIRFAARASLLTFGVIALLIGAVLAASGAFRPVRFVTALVPTSRGTYLSIITRDGRISHLARIGQFMMPYETFPNRVVWTSFNDEVPVTHIWENSRRVGGDLPSSIGRWSSNGMSTWQQADNGVVKLGVWDGETIHTIDTHAEELIGPGQEWTVDNQLWWVQKSWNGTWELMIWDGNVVTTLYTSENRIFHAQFFDCGAVMLRIVNGTYLYRLSDRVLLPIPEVMDTNGILQFSTDNCISFIVTVNNVGEDHNWFWDGMTTVELNFDALAIHGDHEILGTIKSSSSADEWRLIYHQNGERREMLLQTLQPNLLAWTDSTSFWYLSQVDAPGSMLIWQMQTNQFYKYPYAGVWSNSDGVYDPFHGRMAWLDTFGSTPLQLSIWDSKSQTYRALSFASQAGSILLSELRWMRDGSLLITILDDEFIDGNTEMDLYLYDWADQRLEHIGTLPAGTTQFTDWITWE